MGFFSNGIMGGVFSLASGVIGSSGIVGIVALVAGFLLFGGLKRFASTPKGMVVLAGVLIAALAIAWLSPRHGLAGSRGAVPAGRKQVSHQKKDAKAAKSQNVNAAHGPVNRPAMAGSMPGQGMIAGGLPIPPSGLGGVIHEAAPMVTPQVGSLGPMAQASKSSHTTHTAVARHSPAPAPFDPPAMSPLGSAPGAMHPSKDTGLAQAGQEAQNNHPGSPAAGQSSAKAVADSPPAAKAPAGGLAENPRRQRNNPSRPQAA
jgi:hypothetical protein